jgi:methyl-accepting chemotaxis protein
MRPYRRRKYVIDRELQFRLLIYNAIYFLTLLLCIGAGLFVPLYFQISDPTLPPEQLGQIADMVLYIHSRLWPVVLAIFIILSVHSIRISHKIAGPLYRFRAIFKQIAQGEISGSFRIRKGDFLANEKLRLEEMMQALGSKIAEIQHEESAIEEILKEIVQTHGGQLSGEGKQALNRLEEHVLQLKNGTGYFNVLQAARNYVST